MYKQVAGFGGLLGFGSSHWLWCRVKEKRSKSAHSLYTHRLGNKLKKRTAMKILLPILLLTLSACGQNKSKTFSEKNQIQIDSVENIYIKKSSINKDSIKLNYGQKEAFIEKWNDSESAGLYKYLPEYWIILKEKNGSIRKFRTNKDKIKENNELGIFYWRHSIYKFNMEIKQPFSKTRTI